MQSPSPSRTGRSPAPGGRTGRQEGADQKKKAPTMESLSGFFVLCDGQIQSATFQGADNLYCEFEFTQGPDWRVIQGVHHGMSQVSKIGTNSGEVVVWNMPFDVTYKTTNAYGWPRIIVTVYGYDLFGRNIVHGYGTLLVPTTPGTYRKTIHMFTPVSSSLLQQFVANLTGNRPEFWESSFVSHNKGREVTRVKSTGEVTIDINVLTRGMSAHGFSAGGPLDSMIAYDRNSPTKRTPNIYGRGYRQPDSQQVSEGIRSSMEREKPSSNQIPTETETQGGAEQMPRESSSATNRSTRSRRGRQRGAKQETVESESETEEPKTKSAFAKKADEQKDEDTASASTPGRGAFAVTEVDQVGPGDADSETSTRERLGRSGRSRSRNRTSNKFE